MRRKRVSHPKQDILEFPEPKKDWETHGIFSEHYIRNRLKASSLWPNDEAVKPIWELCKNLWDKHYISLGMYDEEFTKQEFLEPILTKLGFAYSRGRRMPIGGKVPDYLLFVDETTKQKALKHEEHSQYSMAISVMEAKKVNHPLGKISTQETPGRFPHQQIRDYLQDAADQSGNPYFRWAILTNGNKWRLYCRDSHPAHYYELNLEAIIASLEKFKVFAALFSPRVFVKDSEGRCPLDDIRDEAFRFQIALEDNLRKRVFVILTDMANGFYKRAENNISKDNLKELYENCLILLYRLLFVLYAEGRDLLPVKYSGSSSNIHYRERYSLQRLIPKLKNSLNFSSDEITELYEDILKLFHLINGDNPALNRKCDVPLYNGGLFDSKKYPLLDQWILGEKTLANVLKGFIFSSIPVEKGEQDKLSFGETIDYADLEIRHLGSIYEGLLENHLELENNNIILNGDRAERKATGTYYTPDYIVRYIVDNTLGPICNEIEELEEIRISAVKKSKDDSFAKVALNLKILDPAMGSGHFLVRATEFLADRIFNHPTTKLRADRVLQGLSQEQAEISYWRRKVVESCIFGVDLNPLAVELSKLSLWLTSIATDQPLSFLDHHLRPGNSLIGANLNAMGWLHTRKEIIQSSLFADLKKEVGQAIQTLHAIEEIETNDLTIIKEKENLWNKDVRDRLLPLRTIADLWTSSFFDVNINDTKYQNLIRLIMSNPKPRTKEAMMLKKIIEPYLDFYNVAEKNMFFHWEIEFPEIFFNEDGTPKENAGFDVIIGNPPYVNVENIKIDQRKFLMFLYETAIKRFDIYVAFFEKGLNFLKNGGILSYIIPYPFLNQNYAEPLRIKIINSYEINKIVDFSDIKVFGDAVIRNCIITVKRPVTRNFLREIDIYKANDRNTAAFPEIKKVNVINYDFIKRMPKCMFRLEIKSSDEEILNKIQKQSINLGKICYVNWGARTGNVKKYVTTKIVDEKSKKMINARNIERYSLRWTGEYIWYEKDQLYNPMFEELFESDKLIVRDISGKARIRVTFDNKKFYAEHTVSIVVLKHLLLKANQGALHFSKLELDESRKYNIKYLLGITNSKLINYYFQLLLGGGLHVYPDDIKQLPIKNMNIMNTNEKHLHNNLVALVDVILDLNKKIQTAIGNAKEQIQKEIDKTDKEIDNIVYKLYGIAEEEKIIIEGIKNEKEK